MPIEFACPSCNLRYSVKDELAGKGAKCGKCGHRMRIPQLGEAKPAAKPATKPAAKPVASSASSAPTAPKKSTVATTPKKPAPATPPDDDFGASWLDEDLEKSQPVMTAAPRGATCPACGAALPAGGVLCVACGYDTRTGAKLETKHVLEPAISGKKKKSSSKLSAAGHLIRGTVFSFIGAMLGAVIWAVIAYLTMFEWSYIAWGLGGLAGLGMLLGNQDGDGTFGGIIAAFMSLFGILAAKVLIVAIFIGAAVANVVGEIDINDAEIQREVVAAAIATEKLKSNGIDMDNLTEEQWEAAIEPARAEVKGMSDEAVEKRLAQIEIEMDEEDAGEEDAEEEVESVGNEPVAEQIAEDAAAAAPAAEIEEAPGFVKVFFTEMFGPIDGLFILLAFFTAYKVGSGDADD